MLRKSDAAKLRVTTIPTVANWIIMAGGVSQANRAMNQTANRVGNVAAAGAGAAVGNIAGKIIK